MGNVTPNPCEPERCGEFFQRCGRDNTYKAGCRCDECRRATAQYARTNKNTAQNRERLLAIKDKAPKGGPCSEVNCGELFAKCGRAGTYDRYRCRCDSCREAKSVSARAHYDRIAANPLRRCTFDGCDKPYKARGLCAGHDSQRRSNKELSPLLPVRRKKSGKWTKREMLDATERQGDCLLFGKNQNQRYGSVWVVEDDGTKRFLLAHRYMYELHTGEDIKGVTVHHVCANPRCINPEHLQRASQAENTLEMLARRDYEAEIARLNERIADLESQLK